MKVVGYIRVSTDEQADQGAGLEAQRRAIEAECSRRGWQLARTIEETCSGAKADRPMLNEAIAAVASGEVDGLIVTKLDRLSRNVAHFSALLERFRRKGWGLVILDLGVDTTTIMGEAMATMAATFAQLERRRIGERTKEALAVKRSQGVVLGRPRRMPAAVRRRIERERAAGKSFAAIAAGLNEGGVATVHGGVKWWPSTVQKALAPAV